MAPFTRDSYLEPPAVARELLDECGKIEQLRRRRGIRQLFEYPWAEQANTRDPGYRGYSGTPAHARLRRADQAESPVTLAALLHKQHRVRGLLAQRFDKRRQRLAEHTVSPVEDARRIAHELPDSIERGAILVCLVVCAVADGEAWCSLAAKARGYLIRFVRGSDHGGLAHSGLL
jgi:hypothetical protein